MKPVLTTFLDVSKAAKLAGMSIRHFRRVVLESKKIRTVEIGRNHKVLRSELEAFLLKKANA